MKVLHINTNEGGGAANAMYRIHKSLVNEGVDSRILYLKKPYKVGENIYSLEEIEKPFIFKIKNFSNRLRQQFVSLFKQSTPISSPYSYFDLLSHPSVQEADVINLHWVSKMLDYPSFFKKINKPVVWTIHDMAPFSPGNHYTVGYNYLFKGFFLNLFRRQKLKTFNSFNNLSIVSPSNWLKDISEKSEAFRKYNHSVIRNPIFKEEFYSMDKSTLREQYGINQDDKIILFLADNINDQRKGVKYFVEATSGLDTKYKIMLVGNGQLDFSSELEIIKMGYVKSIQKLREIYNLADVYVTTALEDNYPNTIIESMSCGTPVIGFKNSGISEMITHQKTGYLARNKSSDDILQGIDWLLSNNNLNIKMECENYVDANCEAKKIAHNYIALYKSIIK
jgi:glycosyltransferase involved in cell wall biosynthesis